MDATDVQSTYSEARRVKELIAQQPKLIQSVIVVSDPFHMWRARWTYRRIFGDDIKLMMAPVPFELSPFKQRWWTDRLSRRYIKDEYIKIAYYIARYQLACGPLKKWLISLDQDY